MDFSELLSALNPGVFLQSLQEWVGGISVNTVVMAILVVFMLVGAVDRIRGNKLGYGEEFENGFMTIGSLALAIAAVVAAAPILALVLDPIITPLFGLFGADPSVFPTMLLSSDMGGYPLAMELAQDTSVGVFSGIILGSTIGPTLAFTIPVAMTIISKGDRPFMASGVLAGLMAVPFGALAGGLVMSFTEYAIPFGTLLVNLLPVIVLAILLIIGLWFKPQAMVNGLSKLGVGVTIVITALMAIAVFQQLTGIMFPLFYLMSTPDEVTGLTGLDSGLLIAGQIGIVLAGAFPMVRFVTKHFSKPLKKLGDKLGMNAESSAGLVASLANSIAMFNIFGKMDRKGKIVNMAFAVAAAFTLGDLLGFTAGVQEDMIFPFLVAKIVAGVFALIIANALAPRLLEKASGTPEEKEIEEVEETA